VSLGGNVQEEGKKKAFLAIEKVNLTRGKEINGFYKAGGEDRKPK